MEKRLEIKTIYCVAGWNGGYSNTIELKVEGMEKPVRMDLTDLLVYFNQTKPKFEIIEPKHPVKYVYISPIKKG